KLPASREKRTVGYALYAEDAQVLKGKLRSPLVKRTRSGEPSPSGCHLQVEQVGSDETLVSQPTTHSVAVLAVVGERGDDDAGVDDDQRASRSDRIALTALVRGTRPPARPPARSRTSSKVGVCASSMRRPSRYSWSDIPAAAARRRSVA